MFFFFFLMIRRPPRSTLFPTRRSSDLPIWAKRQLLDPSTRSGQSRVRSRDVAGETGGVRPGWHPGGFQTRSDRKSTRLNSSHQIISYAVFCLKKKKQHKNYNREITY